MATIAVGSDHAGFMLKASLKEWLLNSGYQVEDFGTHSDERTDYPQFGAAVGEAVATGSAEFGVVVCGSGQGICMAANKVPGARAGVIRTLDDAEMTRRHNNANVACFGQQVSTSEEAIAALQVFLNTPFEGGRHAPRVDQLDGMR
jgi:RpiB/LacA/LacB family sugar-phosphate isomerase